VRRRILVINPSPSEVPTGLLADRAQRIAGKRAEVVAVAALHDIPMLRSSDDHNCAGLEVVRLITANPTFDAVIIGAFGDPGLGEAQGVAPMPVFGLGQSGLSRAAEGGRPFAIVMPGETTRVTVERAVARAGLGCQVVALHLLDVPAAHPDKGQAAFLKAAMDVLPGCIEAGAEAVLFGGAAFAGIEALIGGDHAAAIVDGLTSAMRCALEDLSLRQG